MNNKAHLRPKDFDSNGDIIPTGWKEEKGDLISRSELKKNCAEVVKASNNSDFIPCPTWNKAMELIDNAPTVTVGYLTNCANCERVEKIRAKRPQGEWIMNKTSARGRNYTCTNCQKVSRNKFVFCPNCGAYMREENKNV